MTPATPRPRGMAHLAHLGDVAVGFSDAALDVAEDAGTRGADLPAAVEAVAPGAVAVRMRQVHGADVAVVRRAELPAGGLVDGVDALVTAEPGIALVVRSADCVPVVLADPDAGVVGVAHAGRAGLVEGVVAATLATMTDLGARSVRAWIGPAVCGGCYEVPQAMREEVAALVPQAHAETTWGTPALDIVAGVRAQLAAGGVAEVELVDRCTREDPALHSHRRDAAAAGRLAGIVARVSPAGRKTEAS
ncbi:polyphenol oxidase family protein [Nocardioides massiliensis]|uniref:YfiH family protein n=1 Tax=Nocardioides massiliensis TaxID=1325935 RepID=A0ABT9NSW2_9ACTN|nr:polyphenol oxidase family protein [Nocardioides massiliensis]MDP9823504.1 YfiH family protein [Nocardioides massiliensis]